MMEKDKLTQLREPQSQTLIGEGVDDFASNLLLFDRIEAALLKRLGAQPNNQILLFQLAGCKRKQGKLVEALEYYENLHQCYPDDQRYRFTLEALRGELTNELPSTVLQPHPSPLVQYNNFLEIGTIEETLTYMCGHQADFRPAGTMDKDNKKHYETDARNNTDLSLKGHPLKKIIRQRMWEQLPDISCRLGVEPFKIGHIEVQLRAYHRGEYFRTHQDATMGRRLNFVCFFYPEPKRYSGGELVIFDTDTEKKTFSHEFTRIIPKNNQIVFFPSNYFHAVLPAMPKDDDFLSGRFVINGHVREKVLDN